MKKIAEGNYPEVIHLEPAPDHFEMKMTGEYSSRN